MANTSYAIAIVGGGPSGLMAAIAAADKHPGPILLLEGEKRVGRKLLATGNGRCNLLNLMAGPAHYHGSGAALAAKWMERMPPETILRRFSRLGLHTRAEEDGRVYPYSGQAGAVLDVLRAACERQGIHIRCETEVTAITKAAKGFTLTAGGNAYRAQRVIIAAGGRAAPTFGARGQGARLLAGLGHPIATPFPALAPMKLPPERIRGLKGIRVRGVFTLMAGGKSIACEEGEALFTDYGISGIAIMGLSRWASQSLAQGEEVSLSIPFLGEGEARTLLHKHIALYAGKPLEGLFTGLLHPRLGLCLLREAGLSPHEPTEAVVFDALWPLLTGGWQLPILGVLPFEHAQVTAGGACLDAFDPHTLASRLVPGLYACGEVLDVDGDCGGYNLLWAWISAIVAGEGAARSLGDG